MASTGGLATFFAPAERASAEELQACREIVEHSPLMKAVEESIDGFLMILNSQRQILAVNRQLLQDLRQSAPEPLVGGRMGEIMDCVHACEGPNGCGTSEACSTCGALLTVLEGMKEGRASTGECLATLRKDEGIVAHEYRVRATPVLVSGNRFLVMVFNDISDEKRREALERTFFHDILNTIGGLMGWSSLLQENGQDLDSREVADKIVRLSNRLAREVEDHRRLTQAETGTLDVSTEKVAAQQILDMLKPVFETHDVARNKFLEIPHADPGLELTTDVSLLTRVLTNMTKNAFEASLPGEAVRVWCEARGSEVEFNVRNPGAMPRDVALRIFQRSFSTKSGKGRGIGTYSMKLFGEKYLRGHVSFRSEEGLGTIFTIRLPMGGSAAAMDTKD